MVHTITPSEPGFFFTSSRCTLPRECLCGADQGAGFHAPSRRLLGAKNSAALCDLHIFVDQPAEAVTPDDLDIVLDRVGKGSQRGGLAQGAMRAMLIEVGLVDRQHAS